MRVNIPLNIISEIYYFRARHCYLIMNTFTRIHCDGTIYTREIYILHVGTHRYKAIHTRERA